MLRYAPLLEFVFQDRQQPQCLYQLQYYLKALSVFLVKAFFLHVLIVFSLLLV